MRLGLLAAEDKPEEFGVEEEDGGGNEPGDHLSDARVGEFAHPGAVAGELDQRDDGKGQLKTEYHLAEDEQRGDFVFAGDADNQSGRNDGGRQRPQR